MQNMLLTLALPLIALALAQALTLIIHGGARCPGPVDPYIAK